MPASTIAVLSIFFGFAVLELWRTKLFSKDEQTRDDGIVEVVSSIMLLAVTQPTIILTSAWLLGQFAPGLEGALSDINIFAAIALLLIGDDMTQYWWHRASHTFPWLYNLHRAHHNARYMSVRLVYRNNIIYYAMMPGLWIGGALLYMGLGWIYAGYLIIKMTVIIGAHSDVAWDKPLYKIKALSPIMWVVERTISTPSTHHAHHGRHADDPGTNYKGNYGNLLFFWDVLFGTAKITRLYPTSYGVENLPKATLGQQLAWPLFKQGTDMEAAEETETPGAAAATTN